MDRQIEMMLKAIDRRILNLYAFFHEDNVFSGKYTALATACISPLTNNPGLFRPSQRRNTTQFFTLFTQPNLWMVRSKLMESGAWVRPKMEQEPCKERKGPERFVKVAGFREILLSKNYRTGAPSCGELFRAPLTKWMQIEDSRICNRVVLENSGYPTDRLVELVSTRATKTTRSIEVIFSDEYPLILLITSGVIEFLYEYDNNRSLHTECICSISASTR